MTTINNWSVSLSQNADGTFQCNLGNTFSFSFTRDDFAQFVKTLEPRTVFFYTAVQAFVNNNMNPNTATLAQIKTLLEAQNYIYLS